MSSDTNGKEATQGVADPTEAFFRQSVRRFLRDERRKTEDVDSDDEELDTHGSGVLPKFTDIEVSEELEDPPVHEHDSHGHRRSASSHTEPAEWATTADHSTQVAAATADDSHPQPSVEGGAE